MSAVTEHLLHDVAYQFGMEAWQWRAGDVITLAFEKSGTLYLEPQEEEWLITHARDNMPFDGVSALRVLEACHARHQAVAMTMGYLGDDCRVLVARVPLANTDISALVAVIDRLLELQRSG